MTFPTPGPDRTCIITGASSGIGLELARELARRGYGLTLVARRRDRLEALAGELVASAGIRVEVLVADLTDAEIRSSIPGELAKRGLTVDVLVNNAGFSTVGPVHRTDRDRELAMVRTDVEAVVDLCTLFLPGMVASGRGAVLNVASTAAFQPIPGQAGYAAAKAFVLSYSQAVRSELAGTGVTVTALCPGPVRTEFAETAGMGDQTNKAPAFVWTDVAEVAKQGVEGLLAGRAVVIPGLLNRVSAVGGQLMPRSVLLPILKRAWPAMKASADR